MQFYSNPAKENDKWSLPDCEVFHGEYASCPECGDTLDVSESRNDDTYVCDACCRSWHIEDLDVERGFFYWFVFPGCLPDSSPCGPFPTQEEAITSCQEEWSEWGEEE